VKDLTAGEHYPCGDKKKDKKPHCEGQEFNFLTLSFTPFFAKAKV
jgi:hypothetical protein